MNKVRKIFLITGPSGSGKSTLGQIIRYRFNNVHVIDLDDIDDSSFKELYYNNEEYKEYVKNGSDKAYELHESLNKKKIDKIIKDYPNTNLLFVGLSIPFNNIDHIGYFLDTSSELNYRRINDRLIQDICKKSNNLSDLYLNEDISYIDLITLYEYKVRLHFPTSYDDVKNRLDTMRDQSKKRGYLNMTGKEILKDLEKYLILNIKKLKNNKQLIIHVSGAQGSGKTYLGKKLKTYYGDMINVKDLDDLWHDFIDNDLTNYQGFIDKYIQEHIDKPIIFVGLDSSKCLGPTNKKTDDYYNFHTNHKFYININDNDILRQRFYRQINKLSEKRDWFFENWLNNPDKIQDKLIRYIDITNWKKTNKVCKDIYLERGYKMLSYNDILDKIHKILKSITE